MKILKTNQKKQFKKKFFLAKRYKINSCQNNNNIKVNKLLLQI